MNKEGITNLLIILILCLSSFSAGETVFIEAESFDNVGGWVIDQQFINKMGSPFLLAHGLGKPVVDASTKVHFAENATYRVFVRTRDWVSNWNAPSAPGKFQLLVNDVPLKTTFGTEGQKWHWQSGGTIEIKSGNVKISLHDLTGFEGRCDAVIFTTFPYYAPPDEGGKLKAFRRKSVGLVDEPENAGDYDLVVIGGGVAGTCASISAARLGLKVALIQDRPVLGGNNSSEVRVGLSGGVNLPPYPALGELVDEIGPIGYWNWQDALKNPDSARSKHVLQVIKDNPINKTHNAGPASNYADDKKLQAVQAEKNISLFLNTHAFKVEKTGDTIVAVIGKNITNSRELRFKGSLFVDCTGDGTIGYLAGADYRIGTEAKSETSESLAAENANPMTMGTSVQWYSKKTQSASSFPHCPWALQFNEQTCQNVTAGEWNWETGINEDHINNFEQIRDHSFRVIYGNWAFQKNQSKDKEKYANLELDWVAYIGGKRESRRLLGDVILKQQDIDNKINFPDACVTTTWPIDLHFPDPQNSKDFPDAEFRSISKMHAVKPYAIPYRSLYSRNIDNLMMAGRNISVTHVALGTVRVQRTTGMMGEVVGMAASLCKKYDTSPRGVYKDYLDELKSLMATGVGKKKEAMNRLTEISYMSSADNTLQPAMFLKASTNAPAPLLVALHSWSYGYRQESFINEYVKFCTANNWTLIHPDFRGKNDNPDACGSELVIKDIVSAVEYAKSKACVDEKRIYLVGASGGGHAALLMAARCPELWTAVSAWVPISDLKQWYFQTKQRNVSYYKSLEKICGGAPTFSPEVDRQYAMRSFLSYPKVKYDFKIDINAGIHDGHTGSVPISHSLNAFNMLADPKDRISQADIEYFVKNQAVPPQLVQNISDNSYKNKKPLFRKESNNARVTIFEGSHEIIESAACDWLAKQSK